MGRGRWRVLFEVDDRGWQMIGETNGTKARRGRAGGEIDGETEPDAISLSDQRADLVRQESPKRLHHHQ